MSRDPLNLFEREPAAVSPPSQSVKFTEWLPVVMLLLILAFIGWNRFGGGGSDGGGDRKGDGQEKKVPIEGKTLIFIHERNPQSIEQDLFLREMPKYCEQHGLEYRALDDDLEDSPVPELKTFAASKGVQPPLVVLTGKDNKPAAVISWPANLDGLEALFR